MSNDLAVVTKDIYACREAFQAVLAEPTLNFDREASFAIQVLEGNSYTLKVALQNRQAVVDAVTNIASIGLSLNPAKKQAYFVPRKGKICLDISYMGLMDLAMSTGSVRWGQAKLVYESDVFELNGVDQPPTHTSKPFATDRGNVVGVYVVVKTADGDYLTHPMSIAEVMAIRDRSEAWKAYVKDKTKLCPWVTDPGEMTKKTCVKQAYKYWPKTDRLEKAIHYLNTETDEGIRLEAVSALPPSDPDLGNKWSSKAMTASTVDDLQAVWVAGLSEIQASKDMVAYEQFKTSCRERKVQLVKALEGEAAA
ncbi:recombinase RecT [Pseudomonas chlororaphis]|uniref:recombinase RecT n=1 Tax=Pseudomonas chlororaphis TaxID=587753 RepID=UPI001B32ACBC|nr:recombinase RecT [Pseudomonas chlororaphis]MBP5055340.1 recombinase RecT [Pseudomonas chlororaphis]MBP5142423.1 recombinase RecT [Pseudomonas chlororaphis]